MLPKIDPSLNPALILRNRYVLALSLIAILIIISQIVIQLTIVQSDDYGRVINIAGRQRMLSQKITKLALQIIDCGDPAVRTGLAEDLAESAALWKKSHDALLKGSPELDMRGNNSPAVLAVYRRIEGDFTAMHGSALALAAAARSAPQVTEAEMRALARPITSHEAVFLKGMNEITFQYDTETKERLVFIRTLEYVLLAVTFLTLSLEAMFIFLPAERQITRYFREMKKVVTLLNEQATHDAMTGLFNKRAGLLFLEHEMGRSRRGGNPLSLCFLDLDGLKAINDRLGHEAGDRLIRDFAGLVQDQTRSGDLAFRFGGDEFVLVLDCDETEAGNIRDRIRSQSAAKFAAGQIAHECIFSCGIAGWSPELPQETEAFIKLADARMYEEKARHHAAGC
jgi:diguanylate cyclase (GGDEF)-like protein